MTELTKEEEELLNMEPDVEDFMGRRLHHQQSQRNLYWLDFKSKKEDFVYAKELASFMKLTNTRAHQILDELCMVGIMEKKVVGNLAEYHFVKNGGHTLLSKYAERAKKMLGLI